MKNYLEKEWESLLLTLREKVGSVPESATDFLKIAFYAGALSFHIGIVNAIDAEEVEALSTETLMFFRNLEKKVKARRN